MTTIGVVGGIGPESTVDYYRLLLAGLRRAGDAPSRRILILSIDLAEFLDLVTHHDSTALTAYLLQAVETLARGGAGLALFAANTPHVVFDEVQRRASIPLVSIVAATRKVAGEMGLRRVGLLGTRFTMRGGFYPQTFAEHGIDVVAPTPEELDYVHEKYVSELVAGSFPAATRSGFVALMDRMRERDGIDGVVLGGTELPLLLRDVPYPLPLLDTTRIHVDAVVSRVADA